MDTVVYQRRDPAGGQWDVCHTFTLNFGWAWNPPVILDVNQNQDAIDPAIVYTEDTFTPMGTTMLAQIVWSEYNPASGIYEIQYDAFFLDRNRVPMPITGYVGPFLIRGAVTGATGNCWFPEIASVDETLLGGSSFPFSVVWQEQTAAGQWNVWYDDGTTTTSPVLMVAMTPGSTGQLNAVNILGDCKYPDITATQDYRAPIQIYYYHVNWVYNIWGPPAASWQIDSCYSAPLAYNPGAATFIATLPIHGPFPMVLENPTIASKLTALVPATVFENWMAWEDSTIPAATNPDIWFTVGTYGPPFVPAMAPVRVGYLPGPGGGSIEYNPELWNRNDAARNFPPLTHLVFDQTIAMLTEVEYIDP